MSNLPRILRKDSRFIPRRSRILVSAATHEPRWRACKIRQDARMSDGASKPWWRDWRGLPPFMRRQRAAVLSVGDVWAWRVGWPAFLLAGIVIWRIADDSLLLLIGVFSVVIQWAKLTGSQRRQILGRSRS